MTLPSILNPKTPRPAYTFFFVFTDWRIGSRTAAPEVAESAIIRCCFEVKGNSDSNSGSTRCSKKGGELCWRQIYEAKGKRTGQRVLSVVGGFKVEVVF